jgi:hypothetical protein
MIQISHTEYIAKGQLERFNRMNKFLYNVREVIRTSLLLREEGKFTKEKLVKKIFPQTNWNYDPFQPIRLTVVIEPEDYVIIQDILEEKTGHMWEMDKFLKLLIHKFIQEADKPIKRHNGNIKKFEERFKKFYKNIMESWNE